MVFPTRKIKAIGMKPRAVYDKMKHRKGVESYEAWDNDVERGAEPKLIERSGKAEAATDSGTGQLRGDDGRRSVYGRDERSDSVPQSARDDSREVNTETAESRSEQGGLSDGADRAPGEGRAQSAKTKKADAEGKESAPDVSKMTLRERVDRAVSASENNRALATQFHGVMKDGKMTFPNTDLAMKYLDALNTMEMHDATQYSIRMANSEQSTAGKRNNDTGALLKLEKSTAYSRCCGGIKEQGTRDRSGNQGAKNEPVEVVLAARPDDFQIGLAVGGKNLDIFKMPEDGDLFADTIHSGLARNL